MAKKKEMESSQMNSLLSIWIQSGILHILIVYVLQVLWITHKLILSGIPVIDVCDLPSF